MQPLLEVKLFDEVSPLAPVEASHDEEELVVEGKGRVEVASCVQVGYLRPLV